MIDGGRGGVLGPDLDRALTLVPIDDSAAFRAEVGQLLYMLKVLESLKLYFECTPPIAI